MSSGVHPSPDGAPGTRRNRALAVLAWLVALQGAGLVAVAGYYLVRLVLDRPADLLGVIGVLVMALAGAAGLFVAGRGLAAGHAWARAPVLVAQLILLAVSRDMIPSLPALGIPLAAWALAVAVLLFLPPVSAALQR